MGPAQATLAQMLARAGYQVRVLDSVTLEEANSDVVNWVKQRSRWYKGYLQTMLARWAGGRDRLLSFRVRFQGNVLAGDRVRATGTVTEVRDTERGRVATCEISLEVVGGAVALSGTADVLREENR